MTPNEKVGLVLMLAAAPIIYDEVVIVRILGLAVFLVGSFLFQRDGK